jgi:hypothetical protein
MERGSDVLYALHRHHGNVSVGLMVALTAEREHEQGG